VQALELEDSVLVELSRIRLVGWVKECHKVVVLEGWVAIHMVVWEEEWVVLAWEDNPDRCQILR
jgi:hypothetical protein